MSYSELSKKVIENRVTIRTTVDGDLKRKLIQENHDLMIKMDRMFSNRNK